MFKFKKVVATNFLSIGNMKLNLDERGVVLIEGENLSNDTYDSNGAGKCVKGNQRIYDTNSKEYVTIEKFVKEKRTGTLGLVGNKLKPVEVVDWHTLGTKRILKVVTSNGTQIEAAGTHPILTDRGSIPIADIREGDWVAEARKIPLLNQGGVARYAKETMFSFGALIGDGCLGEANKTVTLTNREEVFGEVILSGLRKEIPSLGMTTAVYPSSPGHYTFRFVRDTIGDNDKKIARELLPYLTAAEGYTGKDKVYVTTSTRLAQRGKRITPARYEKLLNLGVKLPYSPDEYRTMATEPSTLLKELLGRHGLRTGSRDKSLAGLDIDSRTPGEVQGLLSGMFSTDGEIPSPDMDCEAKRYIWGYSSASFALIHDVKRALLMFDIKSTIRVRVIKGREYYCLTTYRADWPKLYENFKLIGEKGKRVEAVYIQGKGWASHSHTNKDVIPPSYNKGLATYSACRKQHRTVGQMAKHGFSREAYSIQGGSDSLSNSDILWSKVKEIVDAGTAETYDITVGSEEHLYVCEGIIVHNSSIFDSITYALYGQTTDGMKADAVVNRTSGKDTAVILDVEIDEQPYRIERYRKHTEHKNKVRLFQGDVDLTAKSASDTSKQIQDLFGIDYDTYVNSIMFGQGEDTMFAQATDARRKEILENVANLAVYKKAQEIAKEKVKEQDVLEGQLTMKVEELTYKADVIKKTYEQELQTYSHTANYLAEAKLAHQELVDENKPLVIAYEVDAKERVLADLYIRLETLESRPPIEVPDTSLLEASIHAWEEQIAKIRTSISIMESKVNDLRRQQASLKTDKNCAYCGSGLDTEHAEREYVRLQGEIDSNLQQVEATNSQLNTQVTPILDKTKEEYASKVAEGVRLQNLHQQDKLDVQSSIAACQREVDTLKDKLAMAETELKTSEDNLARLDQIPKPKDRTAELEAIEAEIQEHNVKILASATSKEKYEETVKIFSNTGIRSVVLDLVTPYLNEQANKYLATLSGSDIEILFSPQSENKDGTLADRFEVEIKNRHGGESYRANSAGEKRRIDLAISFALQDLVLSKAEMRTNLALYDECFDGLDAIGCENVITLLKERQKKVGSIFVITHNTTLKSLFEQVITIQKIDGVSRVKEEKIGANI